MNTWRKGIARWTVGNTLYLSVPFTWLLDDAQKQADEWNGPVHIGGPAIMNPNACEGFEPILFHNPCATFTTRGCPNRCPFCAVPKLEGEFRELTDFRPAPVVCDNNFLAASDRHIWRVVQSLKSFPYVDFNQGLDARLFTPAKADLLGHLKCHIRFSFDSWGVESKVKDAIDLSRVRTSKDISVYVLIGFRDTPEDARAKLELVRSWGIRPNPMRYQPLDAKEKDSYIEPSWTGKELSRMMRFYSRLRWLEHITYEDFQETGQMEMFGVQA